MKKINIAKALKGKGMYIAIASCAVVISGAGIIAYNMAIDDINTDITYTPPATSQNITKNPDSNINEQAGISIEIGDEISKLAGTQPKFMPVAGDVILNPFSNGELVKSETLDVWKTHNGVDIKADIGTTVKAMTEGNVIDVKQDPMWGNCVIIDHGNGIEGYYCNLSSSVSVKAGDHVDAGDPIAVVGNTAEAEISMEPHLHFGLKQNGRWIDPIEYINPSSK
ncbi:MAG: M23 family metallopeptidase [Ruminococcus sp.]|nr:M23 family metallopeptidase [Ruminococcus sp.]